MNPQLPSRLNPRLQFLYGERAGECAAGIDRLLEQYRQKLAGPSRRKWDQRDVVLITYADGVREAGQPPLAALRRFLIESGLRNVINTVHLLPFYPYSSDDGFSVIDYRAVDPACGTWDDVQALGRDFGLMFDLVLNHCSRHSEWFAKYRTGVEPYSRYFIEVDPTHDLSQVTRPRSLPLLTPVETSRGKKHVWTTFSDDQIDLNFAEPAVLLEMVDVLLSYLAAGARIIRLDAIAFAWKRIGTSCVHLRETHELVKLLRDIADAAAPGTILLTETNVPHAENVSYFGEGDEAQMVYQFSLAPLLLDALLRGDARLLADWAGGLGERPAGTTFFNFTASHDGIGVRPLEGLVPPQRVAELAEHAQRRGGRVGTRRRPDGGDSPYELNVTYFDALGGGDIDEQTHARRFLASQAVMLALQGIPGVYFHSLTATPNYVEGAERTGRARTINRRRFELDELREMISRPGTAQHSVFAGYQRLLALRTAEPAFHPDAEQEVLDMPQAAVFALRRGEKADGLVVAANLGPGTVEVRLPQTGDSARSRDLLAEEDVLDGAVALSPYQVRWLKPA